MDIQTISVGHQDEEFKSYGQAGMAYDIASKETRKLGKEINRRLKALSELMTAILNSGKFDSLKEKHRKVISAISETPLVTKK